MIFTVQFVGLKNVDHSRTLDTDWYKDVTTNDANGTDTLMLSRRTNTYQDTNS